MPAFGTVDLRFTQSRSISATFPGTGIPVFLRCAGATVEDRKALPRPIHIPDTKLDLRIAFVTNELILDEAWRDYVLRMDAVVRERPRETSLLLINLSGGTLRKQGSLHNSILTIPICPID